MSGIRGKKYVDADGNIVLTGGLKAAATNKQRHGEDFYKKMGSLGGKAGSTGGFASYKVGEDGLTGRQRAKIAGRKGGSISRRGETDKVVKGDK